MRPNSQDESDEPPRTGGHDAVPTGSGPDAMVAGQQVGWKRSSEHRSVQRMRLVLAALVLIPSLVTIALLLQKNVEYERAVKAAAAVDDQAYDALRDTQRDAAATTAQLDDTERQLEDAQASVSVHEPVDALKSKVSRLQTQATSTDARLHQREADYATSHRAAITAQNHVDNMEGVWILAGGIILASAVGIWLFYRYSRAEKIRAYENRAILDELDGGQLAEAVSAADPLKFETLWRQNREQLTSYHKLILNYASSTRQTTILTLLVGFAFLLVVGVAALFADNVASAIASSVVAAAGATVTGFIGNAVLKNADTSSREVRAFFLHPLEVERALAAERLINEMPTDAQGPAKLLVINALTRGAAMEQIAGEVRTETRSAQA
jgi:Ca2+/Na+ antiporter